VGLDASGSMAAEAAAAGETKLLVDTESQLAAQATNTCACVFAHVPSSCGLNMHRRSCLSAGCALALLPAEPPLGTSLAGVWTPQHLHQHMVCVSEYCWLSPQSTSKHRDCTAIDCFILSV